MFRTPIEHSYSISEGGRKVLSGISWSGKYKIKLGHNGKLKYGNGGLFYDTIDSSVDEYCVCNNSIVYSRAESNYSAKRSIFLYKFETFERLTLLSDVCGGFAVGDEEIIVFDFNEEKNNVEVNIFSLDGEKVRSIVIPDRSLGENARYYCDASYFFVTNASSGTVWLYNFETGEQREFFMESSRVYTDAVFDKNGVYFAFSTTNPTNDELTANDLNGLYHLSFDGEILKINNTVYDRLYLYDGKLYGATFGVRNNCAESLCSWTRNGLVQKYYWVTDDGNAERIYPD